MAFTGLYQILNVDTDAEKGVLHAVIELNDQHGVFKGHFPGNPVLPGVCHIEIVSDLLYAAFGKKYRLKAAKTIKFLNFVNPVIQKRLLYHLEISDTGDVRNIYVSSSFADGTVNFKLNGTFIES